jgi:rhomboid family GlyGly-CTERM serine protease
MRAAAPLLERAPASSLLAFACVALAFAPQARLNHLAYERGAVLAGEAWRLWSGHLVHFSVAHALADALVLLAMGLLTEPVLGTRRVLLAFLLAAPFISVGLLAGSPGMVEYRGASGIAVMSAVLAAAAMWGEGAGWKTAIVLAALAFSAKTVYEAAATFPGSVVLPEPFTVAWQSHVLGALFGIAFLSLRPPPAAEAGAV